MNETFSFSLEFVAEHPVDPVYPYFLAAHSTSKLRSPRLAALGVVVSEITLDVATGGGPTVEFLTV